MEIYEFLIKEKLRGFDFLFKTTYDLFSYRKVDSGTKLLTENINVSDGHVCLDLGCGYGILGIVMAKLNPSGKIYFSDRDVVAVDYTKNNCNLNNISNCNVILSNGFDAMKNIKFDVIVSNLPTHIAKESLIKIISDSKDHLSYDGKFYIVTTVKLENYMRRMLSVYLCIDTVVRNKNYVVLVARKV